MRNNNLFKKVLKCLWQVLGKVKHVVERNDQALTVLVRRSYDRRGGLTTVAEVGAQLLQATLMVAHGSFHGPGERMVPSLADVVGSLLVLQRCLVDVPHLARE